MKIPFYSAWINYYPKSRHDVIFNGFKKLRNHYVFGFWRFQLWIVYDWT